MLNEKQKINPIKSSQLQSILTGDDLEQTKQERLEEQNKKMETEKLAETLKVSKIKEQEFDLKETESSEELEYRQRMKKNSELTKKLENFFGRKMDFGQFEKELEAFKKSHPKKEKKPNFRKEATDHSERKETETEKIFLMKETLALLRKKIVDSFEDWQKKGERLTLKEFRKNNPDKKKLFNTLGDLLGTGEIDKQELNLGDWTLKVVQLAYQYDKLQELKNKLEEI